MKVIILGGCGGMGRYASKAISSFDQIQSLTIADLNQEDAEEFAKQLGSHVEGIGLNINDKELLYGTLKSFDIVILSLIHIPSPRDAQLSRMPSSA